jgi:hypothetical protein
MMPDGSLIDWDEIFASYPRNLKSMSAEIYARDEKIILAAAKKHGFVRSGNRPVTFESADGSSVPYCNMVRGSTL